MVALIGPKKKPCPAWKLDSFPKSYLFLQAQESYSMTLWAGLGHCSHTNVCSILAVTLQPRCPLGIFLVFAIYDLMILERKCLSSGCFSLGRWFCPHSQWISWMLAVMAEYLQKACSCQGRVLWSVFTYSADGLSSLVKLLLKVHIFMKCSGVRKSEPLRSPWKWLPFSLY